jgi:hypothetical protein
MEISRWETLCSDVSDLYFYKLTDDKNFVFSVKDNNFIYDFIFDKAGPYSVADEAFLTHYWKSKTENIGWTFIVGQSTWLKSFDQNSLYLVFPNGLTHFVISTWDLCLEVLSEKAPSEIKRSLL